MSIGPKTKYDLKPLPKNLKTYREKMWYKTQAMAHDLSEINGRTKDHETRLSKVETESMAIKILGGIITFATGIWIIIKKTIS